VTADVDPTPTFAPQTADLRERIEAAHEAARALRTASDRAAEAAYRLARGAGAAELLSQAVDCTGIGALHLDLAGAGIGPRLAVLREVPLGATEDGPSAAATMRAIRDEAAAAPDGRICPECGAGLRGDDGLVLAADADCGSCGGHG
jgi:hypothetical protein